MSQRSGRAALLMGVIVPPLFVVIFLIDGLIHPGYNAVTDYVSELSRGEMGWIQVLNFLILGIGMLTFAAGVRWGARRGAGSAAGPIIFAIVGVASVVGGIFVTDLHTAKEATASGTIHDLAALLIFAGATAASFVFARRFHNRMRIYSIATGVFVVASFVALSPATRALGIMGVTQRVTVIAAFAWITVLALALRAEPAPLPKMSRG
jgi:hypothetical membrane protein